MQTELRELLRDRANRLAPPPELSAPVLRRARRRRWASGVLGAVTAAAVVAGSVVGVQALQSRLAPAPVATPTPMPTPEGVFGGVWPETNAIALEQEQTRVDRGEDPWRLDPEGTAVAFTRLYFGQDDVGSHLSSESEDAAIVDVWDQVYGDSAGTVTSVTLRRLGKQGPEGIWTVTGSEFGGISLSAPVGDARPVPGSSLEVAGRVADEAPVDVVHPHLVVPGGSATDQRMDLVGGTFSGMLTPVPDGGNSGYILSVPAFDSSQVEPGPKYAVVGVTVLRLATGVVPSESTTVTPSPTIESGVFGTMLTTIRAASPPHWTFDLTPGRLDGDWTLDGTVDDGSGPGRLMIDVTDAPGKLEAHPCSDPEFTQGAPCVEEQGVGGSLLVLRGVLDQNGNKTIEVVLVRPDRSGIGAEAGNWIISGTSGNSGGGSNEQVTRADPVYSVDQLGNLVQAVAEKVYPCIQAWC
ncbi:MAG: hypothetical protein M3Q23_04260 [Actinomycetota bacterium]|nr:hypothetical protein [Actinomycetota bacterium]